MKLSRLNVLKRVKWLEQCLQVVDGVKVFAVIAIMTMKFASATYLGVGKQFFKIMISLQSTCWRNSSFCLFNLYHAKINNGSLQLHILGKGEEKGLELFPCVRLQVSHRLSQSTIPVSSLYMSHRAGVPVVPTTLWGCSLPRQSSQVDVNYSSAAGTQLWGHP